MPCRGERKPVHLYSSTKYQWSHLVSHIFKTCLGLPQISLPWTSMEMIEPRLKLILSLFCLIKHIQPVVYMYDGTSLPQVDLDWEQDSIFEWRQLWEGRSASAKEVPTSPWLERPKSPATWAKEEGKKSKNACETRQKPNLADLAMLANLQHAGIYFIQLQQNWGPKT